MSRLKSCAFISALILIISAGSAADEVKSLRGATEIDESSVEPTSKDWQENQGPIAREFVQQPPLAPHSIDEFNIDLDSNMCLVCHSQATYLSAGATKISDTHFAEPGEGAQAEVAGQRYFCKQCHVSQRSAEPLVENSFRSANTEQE
jgi:cytochrome c-type protein NapB